MARQRDIKAVLGNSLGVSFPNNPTVGRFHVMAKVAEGPKAMVGRTIVLELTYDDADGVRDGLSKYMIKYPKTGRNVVDADAD